MRFPTFLLLGLGALPSGACDRPGPAAGDPVAGAEAALARGDLERAEDLLEEAAEGEVDRRTAELRKRVEHEQTRRAAELARVDAVLAGIPDQARIVVQRQLQELRGASRDPAVRRAIDARLSELGDLYADARRAQGAPGARQSAAAPGVAPARDGVAPAREDRLTTAWDPYAAEAGAADAPGGSGADARTGAGDGRDVRDVRHEAAPAVTVEVTPEASRADGVPPAPPADRQPAGAPDLEPSSDAGARPLLDVAREHLRRGELAAARDAFLRAAAAASYGSERDELVGFARDADDRRQLHAELAGAFAADPRPFQAAGFDEILEGRVVRDGVELGWSDLAIEPLEAAAALASLSSRAQLGLVHERLARRHVRAAWSELAALHASGRLDAATIADVVSRFRGERIPEGGYLFRGDGWVARAAIEAEERADRLAGLAARFARVRVGRRAELAALAGDFRAEGAGLELSRALAARFDAVAAELARDRTAKRIDKLADARARLDAARAAALELIFDEEEYFFPYQPPECRADQAALYPAVQRRVDELVGDVRRLWDSRERVKIGKEFQELRHDVAWIRAAAAEMDLALGLDALPGWFEGVAAGRGEITLQDFAWDAAEAAALERDRAVLAYNERMWSSGGRLEGATPDAGEQRQVEITNEYRRMLGRCALAWNPSIQSAARDHSDYMSDTGDFGHFEPDPETRTPNDRMRRRGYPEGRSENCAMTGGPDAAHDGWLHSSGHHRNILMPGHREMASAVAGTYWTQNFGGGRSFESDL